MPSGPALGNHPIPNGAEQEAERVDDEEHQGPHEDEGWIGILVEGIDVVGGFVQVELDGEGNEGKR